MNLGLTIFNSEELNWKNVCDMILSIVLSAGFSKIQVKKQSFAINLISAEGRAPFTSLKLIISLEIRTSWIQVDIKDRPRLCRGVQVVPWLRKCLEKSWLSGGVQAI
jgi:hypothetical protein